MLYLKLLTLHSMACIVLTQTVSQYSGKYYIVQRAELYFQIMRALLQSATTHSTEGRVKDNYVSCK
jgi:hypothetical protein